MDLDNEIKKILEIGFAEDIGAGDVTGNSVIPEKLRGEFVFRNREPIVFCGAEILKAAFSAAHPALDAGSHKSPHQVQSVLVELFVSDGDELKSGSEIAKINGDVREILRKERVVLNLLQHLSGIATLTAEYVKKISHTKAKILDTRKTIPGLRALQKYAVTCGGGQNHRMGLYDMVMVKDNHIRYAGGIMAAVSAARNYLVAHPALDARSHEEIPHQVRDVRKAMLVEVECDNLLQVAEAVQAGADIILADNMSNADLKKALEITNGKIPVEASGNVSLETVAGIAETGVDFISVGKLTHSVKTADIGLDEMH